MCLAKYTTCRVKAELPGLYGNPQVASLVDIVDQNIQRLVRHMRFHEQKSVFYLAGIDDTTSPIDLAQFLLDRMGCGICARACAGEAARGSNRCRSNRRVASGVAGYRFPDGGASQHSDRSADQDAGNRAMGHRFPELRLANPLNRLIEAIGGIEVTATRLAENLVGLDVKFVVVVVAHHYPDRDNVGLRRVHPEVFDLLFDRKRSLWDVLDAGCPVRLTSL